MFNIEDYLKRVVGIIDKGKLYQKEIAEIIKKHTGIEPASTESFGEAKKEIFFEIKDGVLITKLTPGEKNMIFIKKEVILAELKSFNVKDIRW